MLRVLQLPRLSFPAAGHFRGGVLKHESCSISSLSRRSDRHNRCALHVSCLQTAPMKSAVKRGSSSHSRSPGLRVRLPSEKDALVTLRLRDGKLAKSHVGTLCKHSGLFASALQQGTEFEVEHCLLGRRFPVSFQIDLLLRCILIGSTYCCEHTNGKNRHRKPSFSTCLLHAMKACQAAAKWAAACTKLVGLPVAHACAILQHAVNLNDCLGDATEAAARYGVSLVTGGGGRLLPGRQQRRL